MKKPREPALAAFEMSVSLGERFEREIFGKCMRDVRSPRLELVRTFRQARRVQKSHFDWDPLRPGTVLGARLFETVQNQLPNGYRKHLRLYVSLGTELDRRGIDGFFTLYGKGTVTIDLATRRHGKKQKIKADVLVTRTSIADLIGYKFEKLALAIAEKLLQRDGLKSICQRRRIENLRKLFSL